MNRALRTQVLGLFPAAGRATRLGELPCSKEILAVTDTEALDGATIPVGAYLLRYYRRAGIRDIALLRRAEKQDIVDTFGQATYADLKFIDRVIAPTPSTTHTIDCAWPLMRDRPVALGYPDIIIDPPDMIDRLVGRLFSGTDDICLSLVDAQNPRKWDMVEFDGEHIRGIAVKPGRSAATHSWVCAVWRSGFTDFLHNFLPSAPADQEVYVGHVIDAAIRAGLRAGGVYFPDARVLDIGTPDDLARARTPVSQVMAAEPRDEP